MRAISALLLLGCSAMAAGPAPAPRDEDLANPMRLLISRYETDLGLLHRALPAPLSPRGADRMRRFHETALADLEKVEFDALGQDGRVDYVLFRNHVRHELEELALQRVRDAEIAQLLPFRDAILELEEARRRMETVDPARAAGRLTDLARAVRESRRSAETAAASTGRVAARRSAQRLDSLREMLKAWQRFYAGYHPEFTWWAQKPWEEADRELAAYAVFLRDKVARENESGSSGLVGDPIGREALLRELAYEMVPYSPEELIALAEREFAWCEERQKEAARDLGLGGDWAKALEKVKSLHVPPGKQPDLVRDLAEEAVRFLDERDLVTIPALCREGWRMEMMSPERQRVTPYFTGGEVISVSFPTADMSHEQKLMSLRGNNVHFSRATVHHELIPGHHLQGFMAQRHRAHRRIFRTAFLVEGWALWWEFLLWDLGFPKTAEDRVGMLFWRSHRCARIIVSLKFHLGQMSPQEMTDFLVRRVGHEPDGATAEVRRYIGGGYGPLYQCAYMLGGIQLRALHRELVASGKMSARDFHDAVLRENSIPVEMIRASLTKRPPARDFAPSWRFMEEDR